MRFRRGDIILLTFPFSDGIGGKLRPAVVVQANTNNERLINTIVAMITSTTDRAAHEPTQLLIDVHTPEGKQSGLLHTSAIKCENLFTVELRLIARAIGTLPQAVMTHVDLCLKKSLGLTA
jgi:mRNA interferase MazF